MRLPDLPTLHQAIERTAVQRLIAVVAIALLASAVLYWPQIASRTSAAFAQGNNDNYQPFKCDSSASPGTQAHRANLNLYNSDGSLAGAKAYPCISGVKWKLKAGDVSNNAVGTNCSGFLCSGMGSVYANATIGVIQGAYAQSGQSFPLAGNGTMTGMVHIGFKGLQFCAGANNPAFSINGFQCSQPVNNIQLYADSSTTQGGITPGNNYVLNISPTGPITIGGNGVVTDVWGDPDSVIRVPTTAVPLQGTGCGAAGGVDKNWGCRLTINAFSGTISNWFAQGGNYPLTGVDLNFYYMISHGDGNIDPYVTAPPGNSVVLPNTRILVNDGS